MLQLHTVVKKLLSIDVLVRMRLFTGEKILRYNTKSSTEIEAREIKLKKFHLFRKIKHFTNT